MTIVMWESVKRDERKEATTMLFSENREEEDLA